MPNNSKNMEMLEKHSGTVSDLTLAASRTNDPFWAELLEKMAQDLKEALEHSEKARCA
ncbi:MAG: hypothetical protein OEY85_05245 [Rhodospirillales bacterium]|nr:hypothetical protein [Rhodospirillales bacterium]